MTGALKQKLTPLPPTSKETQRHDKHNLGENRGCGALDELFTGNDQRSCYHAEQHHDHSLHQQQKGSSHDIHKSRDTYRAREDHMK